jgi:hypothetical protein
LAKKINPQTETVSEVNIMTADPTTLTREQLKARYEANVAERNRLADENKTIQGLYKGAVSSEKKSSAEAKIAALQAKLAALQNPTPVAFDPVAPATADPAIEARG